MLHPYLLANLIWQFYCYGTHCSFQRWYLLTATLVFLNSSPTFWWKRSLTAIETILWITLTSVRNNNCSSGNASHPHFNKVTGRGCKDGAPDREIQWLGRFLTDNLCIKDGVHSFVCSHCNVKSFVVESCLGLFYFPFSLSYEI